MWLSFESSINSYATNYNHMFFQYIYAQFKYEIQTRDDMFISALELFNIGISPSSSHTIGPMVAAKDFITLVVEHLEKNKNVAKCHIRCILYGSLSFTGKGHATDVAVVLGLHGYSPEGLALENVEILINRIWNETSIKIQKKNTG